MTAPDRVVAALNRPLAPLLACFTAGYDGRTWRAAASLGSSGRTVRRDLDLAAELGHVGKGSVRGA